MEMTITAFLWEGQWGCKYYSYTKQRYTHTHTPNYIRHAHWSC